MEGMKYLIAWTIIAAPQPIADLFISSSYYDQLQPTVKAVALQLQVFDEREERYILARAHEFVAEIAVLRNRYHDLADCPLVCDRLRFPNKETVSKLLEFNRTYREHLVHRRYVEQYREAEITEAIRETDILYRVWDTVRDFQCDIYYTVPKRVMLAKLKEMIGCEDYYWGRLPPPVPLWRFTEVN